MNIDAIKILKEKLDDTTFTLEQVLMICPEFKEQTELLDLLDNPFVVEYNRLMAEVNEHLTIPDVNRYVELTTVKTKVGHNGGAKGSMPCLVCGEDSHSAKWTTAKINGIDHWVGDVSSPCTSETRFQIRRGISIADMALLKFPFSQGQLAGRYKKDGEDNLHPSK